MPHSMYMYSIASDLWENVYYSGKFHTHWSKYTCFLLCLTSKFTKKSITISLETLTLEFLLRFSLYLCISLETVENETKACKWQALTDSILFCSSSVWFISFANEAQIKLKPFIHCTNRCCVSDDFVETFFCAYIGEGVSTCNWQTTYSVCLCVVFWRNSIKSFACHKRLSE